MGGSMPWHPPEQLAHWRQHERQHDALGLGELERALKGVLRTATVAKLLPGPGVERQRLGDHEIAAELARRDLRSLARSTSTASSGRSSASPMTAAAIRIEGALALFGVEYRRARPAAAAGWPMRAWVWSTRARVGTVNGCSSASSVCVRSAAPNAAKGLLEPAPAPVAAAPARSETTSSTPTLAVGLPHPSRPMSQASASSKRPQPDQRQGACGQAGEGDRILLPSVSLRDPHHLLAVLETL